MKAAFAHRRKVRPLSSREFSEEALLGPTMRELCPWYALSVKHQHEQAVRAALDFKGFEALAPTYRVKKRWSDRIKELDLPLFSGYVFCRFSVDEELDHRAAVLNTPAVSRMVGFGGNPAPISNGEIQAIQKAMAAGLAMRPWPHLKPGDRVRVERGPLRGVEGQLLRNGAGLQLVVAVELLQRSVAVTMDADAVVPVPAAGLDRAATA